MKQFLLMMSVWALFLPTSLFGHDSPVLQAERCNRYYIGFEGGLGFGIGHGEQRLGVGFLENETATEAHPRDGYAVGAEIGYYLLPWIRTDLSYSFFNSRYKWRSASSLLADEQFRAHLDLHLLLVNIYFHLNPLLCLNRCFDPYLSAGIGIAHNRLSHIEELDEGVVVAEIDSHRHTHFGARVGAGVLVPFGRCWSWDFAVNANYIGDVLSGYFRTFGTLRQAIGAYNFKNNWVGILSIGLKYNF